MSTASTANTLDEPRLTWPLPGILAARARAHGAAVCLIDAVTGEEETYEGLLSAAGRVAHGLTQLGIEPGDTVATMITHSLDTYRVWFGLTHIGVLEVPLSTRYKGHMLRHVLEDSGARAVILDEVFLDELVAVLEGAPLPRLRWVVVRGTHDAAGVPSSVDVLRLDEIGASSTAGDRGEEDWERLPHELSMVLYTSGTTGASKGVLVPWGQVGSVAAGAFPEGTHQDGDVLYCPFPPNHIGGRLFPAIGIRHGLPVVIRESFSASEFWRDIERHHCTTAPLVSAMANILWRAPADERDGRTPLRNVLMLPVIDEFRQFEERFGVRICTVFNMTEISIALQSGWEVEDPRSCGRVRVGPPGYELRLVDDNDWEVEPGQVGELVCRTEEPWTLNAGYFGRPEQTAAAWRNGWFHTGDAFRRDDAGRYYFVDRIKDAIRRRGENVSSFEVEREVRDHPEVVDCAAIGVPSPLGEEDIKLFAVTVADSTLTEADVIAHVAAKAPSFMVPTFVEFVPDLPRTQATERVRKAELRDSQGGASRVE